MSETTVDARLQFCTFTLHGLLFGLEVNQIQEVLLYQDMTRVPLAPPMVRGLINLRGQIVTAIDLRRRLGLAPRAAGEEPMNVVLRTEDGAVSLLVDQIGDVLTLSEAQFEETPSMLDKAQRELLRGVYKLEGQLLLALETRGLLELAQAAPAHAG